MKRQISLVLAASAMVVAMAFPGLAAAHNRAHVILPDGQCIIVGSEKSVSMPDGTSAALYQRDPEMFRELTRKTIEIHRRLLKEWPRLAAEYRQSLGDVTSPQTWEKTFAPWLDGADDR